ncbi:hypothetical protein RJO15_24385 [Herbaspirillum huttiense F1]|uniref:Uncharacterized protein n=1 Tax=Herbaspirillum huttiense subsp. lycopersici TaxID=3074428 RepID=A0ABU2ERJ7_9BURK|nr:hypothetical protein [Herbaspirillum huttiense]MDR9850787.1 hypothetical protein [Herbaspirillum huttiense SE1]MDT0358948.1 hypothetical protein [Herbaspirillum huttiense F1]
MVRKINIQGNVSQLINGDVHSVTGPTTTETRNSSEVKETENPQKITEFQRKRINVLVKEWSAISGEKEVEIYKIFMKDFGIRYFRELPIEHYSTVKETLEEWISTSAAKACPVVAPEVEKVVLSERAQHRHGCPTCLEKDASFARTRRELLVLRALAFAISVLCGWLLYKLPAQM